MSNNIKRISIARAIMYKELAKRNAAREFECKRRGLWVLWQHQTQYKTLWHFLRASDKRLIEVCYNTMDNINTHIVKLHIKRGGLMRADQKSSCLDTRDQLELVNQRILYHVQSTYQISKILNKLMEVKNNENQN